MKKYILFTIFILIFAFVGAYFLIFNNLNFQIPQKIKQNMSPIGGKGLLRDDKCIISSDVDDYKWGIILASKEFLIQKGYSKSFFDEHFCAISVKYEYHPKEEYRGMELAEFGYGRVVYKATFEPYLAYWQDHFRVVLDTNKQPLLQNGIAVVDVAFSLKFEPYEIDNLLSPKELHNAMENLIGKYSGQINVYMGPTMGKKKIRLYAEARNENPDSNNCGNTERIGTIDVETGEGVITFSGSC